MASLNELIAAGELCNCLRAKSMFYEVEGLEPADPALAESRTHGYMWCLHTQSVLGPDGSPVEIGSCRPGRACCTTA